MRLLSRRGREPRKRLTLPTNPRQVAVELLADKIRLGHAGLDPYDPSIFIVRAGANERVWTNRALDLTGIILNTSDEPGGISRFRALLEADIRDELDLDGELAPLMRDEPLASRGIRTLHAVDA